MSNCNIQGRDENMDTVYQLILGQVGFKSVDDAMDAAKNGKLFS